MTTAPAPVVENYHNVKTVPQVFELVGEDICARWEKLGTMDSKVHWAYGGEADQLIAEGIPSMLVYKAIAIKAGKSSQTIRKAYYTFKAFTVEQRAEFEIAPYSIFQHARTCADPIEVLQYYKDNRTSLDEIEIVYPPAPENVELDKEFKAKGYPRMFYGVYRELWGCDPFLRARADELIKELDEIIKQVNK